MRKLALRFLAFALLAGLIGLAIARITGHKPRVLRLATGQKGGTFLPLGEVLARGFEKDIPKLHVEVLESAGGEASIERLDRHEVDLALVSNHVSGRSSVTLIAPLYQETLQIVVADASKIATTTDLRGHRVNVGAKGSGTEVIADTVLAHFAITPDSYQRSNLTTLEAVDALEGGRIDAAFIVAGMRTPAVDRLLVRKDMHLLSLGEPGKIGSALEGIQLDAPFLETTTIPERAYGNQPEAPIGTIRVHALLVARSDLDEDLVYDLGESLFSHKVELATQQKLLSHLTEKFDPAVSPYPLHPGADRYYRRSDPNVLEKYTDQISLFLTVAAILWSAIAGVRAWRRTRQNERVETWLEKGRTIAEEAKADADPPTLKRVRQALEATRDEAVKEVERDRLEVNDTFLVLQSYLTARIAEIDRRLVTETAGSEGATDRRGDTA